ncbi:MULTISPECIES: hypothetical protein [Enterobacter]|jgi:hypothetical protein|nr:MULTISPECIES: hypothetical protein [Enterobacter]MCK7257598.1 hypothetical protein [Enterobacter asburiae]MCU6346871.1 hypothetical protein [Enterobacter quasiroggenkampii]WFC88286.1 hypothetical protein OM419_07530 [Enterobacter roggenkampii]
MNLAIGNKNEVLDLEDKMAEFEKELLSEIEVSDDMLDIISGGNEMN